MRSAPADMVAENPSFSWILNQAYWRWRKSPALSVPVMIGLAVSTSAQTMALIPFVSLLMRILEVGLVGEVIASLARGDPSAIVRVLVKSGALNAVTGTVLVSIAIYISADSIGRGFSLAAEYGSYLIAASSGSARVEDVVMSGFRLWAPMFRTYLLHEGIVVIPLLPSFAYLLLKVSVSNLNPEAQEFLSVIFSFVLILFIGLLASAILRGVFLLTYPTVAIQGKSGIQALKISVLAVLRTPNFAVGYVATRLVGFILLALLTLVFSFFGSTPATIITLAATLIIDPVLHITKTLIFMTIKGYEYAEEPDTPPVSQDFSTGLPRDLWSRTRAGLAQTTSYVAETRNFPFHMLSTGLFVIGLFWGLQLGSEIKPVLQALGIDLSPARRQVLSFFPSPLLSLDVFLHNWQAALAISLSGMGFGVPTTIGLVTNGVIVGAVTIILPTPVALVGLLPHGVIEVPAFLLAGSLGFLLAFRVLRSVILGEQGYADLARALRVATYLVLGLAPIFFIAGIVETFLTPILLRELFSLLVWPGL